MESKKWSFPLWKNYFLTLVLNKDLGLLQLSGVFVIFGVSVKKRQRIDAMVRASSVGIELLFFKVVVTKFYQRV